MSSTTKTTSVHVTALDSIVSVNGLFTAIVFLGISFNASASAISTTCTAGTDVLQSLIMFEVVSFSCFLFSSLIAHGLKLHINLLNSYNANNSVDVEKRLLKFRLVASSAGSASGCVFLMLAMVNVIQIRLGTLLCSKHSFRSCRCSSSWLLLLLIFIYAVYDAAKISKESQSSHNNNNNNNGDQTSSSFGKELKQLGSNYNNVV